MLRGRPEAIVTEALRSYLAVMCKPGNLDRCEMDPWNDNRVERSHLSSRRRESAMLRLRLIETIQKFTSVREHRLVDRLTNKLRHSATLAE